MDQVLAYVDLTRSTMDLARQDFRRLRSKHPVVLAARDVEQKARQLTFATALPFEGMFLSASAQFELAIRNMIEMFVDRASLKHIVFNALPNEMRAYHIRGSATILQNLERDKFRHLNSVTLIANLASCDGIPAGTRYRLTREAFSNVERNFKSDVIKESLSRLGLKDPWRKIGSKGSLRTLLQTTTHQLTAVRAKTTLDTLMIRRNQLIHRGISYTAPSEADIRECAEFYKVLVHSIAEALEDHLLAI